MSTEFNNSGTVDAQVGGVGLQNGGTHSGTFNIEDGATLRLSTASATTHVLDAGTSFTGTGTPVIGTGEGTSDTVLSNTARA